jgi:hypothetical protein
VLDSGGITATGDVVGTLAYMAPEQAEGERPGAPADVYALSLTLYEAWSGENPNARATPAATARAIGEPVMPLDDWRPDLPAQLCETIDDCLDPDPALRPSLPELRAALEDALPDLATAGRVPRPRRSHPRLGAAIQALATRGPVGWVGAAAVAGLAAAAMLGTPSTGPAWSYLLPVVAGILTLLWPRLGFVVVAAGLAAWLAFAADRPGAGLVVAVLALPPALLVANARALPLPAASPLLGLAALAPVYPALAGLGAAARDRLVLGAAGYAWLAVAESVWRRELLFGTDPAPAGWSRSAGEAGREVLLPLLTDPAFAFGVALWSLAALTLGLVVRGRNPALDLLGALIWSAALVAALRLSSEVAGPPPGVLAAAVLAVVAASIAWRARTGEAEHDTVLRLTSGRLREAGREATLS